MIRAGSHRLVLLAAGAVPLVSLPLLVRDQYQLHVASLIGCYWILIAGLNLPPFDTPAGFYWLVLSMGALVTWLTWNVARFMWGRALIAIRDSEVAAASVGIPIYHLKLAVFAFSGVTAGIAGALFASLQSYITPETFGFDTGLFFFVCIVIGGRGSILGPFMGTVVLTALPEVVAPLAKLGNFFYGLLLLAVVLLVPEGIGRMFGLVAEWLRPPPAGSHGVNPDLPRLAAAISPDANP
jgi:ABC-type branched-subunit amino acid transport system permease subunit